ncbi:MAG: hypothetical protein H6873_05525 [Hyphomicrobiaceae bacterium]|nr:hypothetical protein [Hyphomicrobiaceae bacterium]
MNQTAAWSDANVARLRELAAEGLTLREIAVRFDRHYSTIQHHAQRHGIAVARTVQSVWTPALEARLRRLVAAGRSRREIAGLMGLPLAAVSRRVTHLGLSTRGFNRPPPAQAFGPEVKTSKAGERFAAAVLNPAHAPGGARLLPLSERAPGMCCWPYDGPEGGTVFCAADVTGEGDYCPDHAARMFAGGRRRNE